jgi:diaminopimelate epimerase
MSGAGNLFSVINNDNYKLSKETAKLIAPIVCNINEFNNIRTEGLILINSSDDLTNDFFVDFYNPDGSNDAMCGNGSRCAVHFADKFNLITNTNRIFSMADAQYQYIINKDTVKVFFPPLLFKDYKKTISLNGHNISGSFIDVGSKHFVIDYNDISELLNEDFFKFDINSFAPQIRYADEFSPAGVNVNIYNIIDNLIYLRTYERGVEAETGACGTGAISTSFSVNHHLSIHFPITIIPPSKNELIIDIIQANNEIINISLEGGAEIFNSEEIEIPLVF